MRHSFLFFLLSLSSIQALASSNPQNAFKTEEFQASRALEVINAADAYALGYTGVGQTVGILDTAVRIDHPELFGKSDILLAGESGIPTWSRDTLHGSHVAGIIAAKRDGIGMHGVAFDSAIWSGDFLNAESYLDLPQYFANHPEVRIFNNSWGESTHTPTFDKEGEEISIEDYMQSLLLVDYETAYIEQYAKEHPQTVFVFAAGNEGQLSPGFPANLPRYVNVGDLSNWITVGAVNANNGSITKAENGELHLNQASIPWFTNLARGSELYTVMAPGSNIFSLDASTNDYMLDSGTSMAAPVVSGALALVAQAYPWMSGKQLADTVLTTANSTFNAPQYAVLYETANLNPLNGDYGTIRLVIIAENRDEAARFQSESTLTIDGILISTDAGQESIQQSVLELLEKQIQLDPSAWIGGDRFARQAVENGDFLIEVLTREEVFGQGILDVGKAVRGPAKLDANRMNAANVMAISELGNQEFAVETFDTQGYVAEFSNDISQKQWDDAYHHSEYQTSSAAQVLVGDENRINADALYGKDVGLRKAGTGVLVLSGSNSYEGATLVEEGVLAVAQRADGSGGELTVSDVVVREKGILTGDGIISNQVINKGVVAPGFAGNTLTVGNYTQSKTGALHVTFDNKGTHSILAVKEAAQIAGELTIAPTRGQFYANQYSVTLTDFLTAQSISGDFDSYLIKDADSPTLEASFNKTPTIENVSVTLSRPYDAYAQYADNSAAKELAHSLSGIASVADGDMQTLLAALDWSASDGHEIEEGLDMLGAEAYDASARAALVQQNEFNSIILRRLLNRSVSSGKYVQDWQPWATTYGGGAWQDNHGGVSSWKSLGVGVIAGADKSLENSLRLGAHVALSSRRTHLMDNHNAQADTQSAFIGLQTFFAPSTWDGFWVASQARLGIESGKMTRSVSFGRYARSNKSRWDGFAGSVLLGGGKNWRLSLGDGGVDMGPLAWVEYGLLQRPDITENTGNASRLHVNETLYQSLLLSVGAHVDLNTELENGTTMEMDLLAAWRHEMLDGTFRTDSYFMDYGHFGFSTSTDLPGKDAMLVQSSVRLSQPSDVFVEAYVGGEFFRTGYTSANVGIQFGWVF